MGAEVKGARPWRQVWRGHALPVDTLHFRCGHVANVQAWGKEILLLARRGTSSYVGRPS